MGTHDGASAADIIVVPALYESNSLDRRGLGNRGLRCADVGDAGDPRAHAGLIDVTAVVELPSDHAQSEHTVDDRQVDLAVEVVVAAGVRGLRAFHGHVATESIKVRRIGDESDRAAHGTRAVQGALGSAQYFYAIQVVQPYVGFEAAPIIAI